MSVIECVRRSVFSPVQLQSLVRNSLLFSSPLSDLIIYLKNNSESEGEREIGRGIVLLPRVCSRIAAESNFFRSVRLFACNLRQPLRDFHSSR